MKRCVLPFLFAVLISLSFAETSAAADRDSVAGTARHLGADPPFPVIQVHMNAFSGASGAVPRGFVIARIKSLGVIDRARVVCLSAIGNRATVGTEIVRSNNPALVGQGQLWSVVDDRRPGGLDRVAGFPITPTPPVACPPLFFN